MCPLPNTILLVAACLLLNSLADRRAHAETLPVVVMLQPIEPDHRSPGTPLVQASSRAAVKEALDYHRINTPGWECIEVFDEHKSPFLTVLITVLYRKAEGIYGLGLSFIGRAKRPGYFSNWTRPLQTDQEAAAEAGREAKRTVDEWIRAQEPPCKVPVKVSGRGTGNVEGGDFSMPFEAEGALSLDTRGSFQAVLPYKFTMTMNAPPCTGRGAAEGTLEVAGGYNPDDGTLRFSRMYAQVTGGTFTLVCPGAGAMSAPFPPGLTGEAAEAADLRVPLADGGKDSTSVSPQPGWTREMTVEINYRRGSRPCC